MKYILYFFALSFPFSSLFPSFDKQALLWCNELIVSATHEELQYIANLIYFSYLRSCTTLSTQKILLEHLNMTWQKWYIFNATRRDPLHKIHETSLNEYPEMFQNSQKLFEGHMKIGKIYDQAIQQIGNKTLISPEIQTMISTLRNQVRTTVAQTCIKELITLGQQFCISQKTLMDASTHYQNHSFFGHQRSLVSMLTSYFPPLFMKSFITFDEGMLAMNKSVWDAFYDMQLFNNHLWTIIETCRSTFYQMYYSTLLKAMDKKQVPLHYYYILFEETGILAEYKRTILLPDILM